MAEKALARFRVDDVSGNHDRSVDKYPTETVKLLLERASCRDFLDKRIPIDILQVVLEAGMHAPTAGNLQPYSIIRIENVETKQKFAKMCGQSFICRAPVLLLFCLDLHRNERWAGLEVAPYTATSSFRHFWVSFQDTIICAQNICTAADSVGLGSVYIGTVIDMPAKIQTMLRLPKGVFPVVLLCLGYPKKRQPPRNKLNVDAVVHQERYHEMKDKELMNVFNKKYEGQKLPVGEKRLETILKVCRTVRGEEFAENCEAKIRATGHINTAQYYFCLHYRADLMPKGNDKYLKIMEESGFNWFRKYRPFARVAKKKQREVT
jgi:nitroreductase